MDQSSANLPLHRDHRRQWRDCLYVYPVLARRSRGLSIGVNLNPDKLCTFSCLYCQIDRRTRRGLYNVDLDILRNELTLAMGETLSGRLWQDGRFAQTPPALRRLNDIAFSGDGEPTMLGNFDQAVQVAADVKAAFSQDQVKLVVITNATLLDSPQVRRALPILDAANGEIWAKLDAGTEEHFLRVNRPHPPVTLVAVVQNLIAVARQRPIVIQTLLFRLDGNPPAEQEISAYCRRVREIVDAGGKIKLIQLHTIARAPSDPSASALTNAELHNLAARIAEQIKPVPVETFPGSV